MVFYGITFYNFRIIYRKSLLLWRIICVELLVFAAIKIIMMKNPIIGISVSKKCVRFLLTGGNDARGRYLKKHIGLAHSRLAIRDILCGNQPMTRSCDGRSCTIVYNGEIYNTDEIIPELNKNGYVLSTTSDTEVILYAYMHYGADFVEKLNGIFAIAIWDGALQKLFLFRDPVGS